MHKDFVSATRPVVTDEETGEAEEVFFTLDGDRYDVLPGDPPVGFTLDLAKIAAPGTKELDRLVLVGQLLDDVLLPESADRLGAALRDTAKPVYVEDVLPVLQWLIEEVYSGRPTESAPPSSNGRRTTGRTSTAGARPKG